MLMSDKSVVEFFRKNNSILYSALHLCSICCSLKQCFLVNEANNDFMLDIDCVSVVNKWFYEKDTLFCN